MKRALIYLDPEAPADSIGLLGAVDRMYGDEGYQVYGLIPGPVPPEAAESFDYLIRIDEDSIDAYDIINLTGCIEELHAEHCFDAVLIPATVFGRMLAPRAAMRLQAGLVADVTAVRRRNGVLELVRPAFSGRMMAGIAVTGEGPVMLSVRPNIFRSPARKQTTAVSIEFRPRSVVESGVRLVTREEKPRTDDIRESEVLVSGGGGVLRHFDRLEELARMLNGKVAASRRVVDSGKAPRHIQVGQSGKTVSPRLYLALGISGSIQHVVGLKNAETVIAVNRDRHAPICSLSDLVVEGDAREFLDRIIERIKLDGNRDTAG